MNYAARGSLRPAATPQRFRTRSLTPHTSVRNLYLTGQDVASLAALRPIVARLFPFVASPTLQV
jgi:hypothetical protein